MYGMFRLCPVSVFLQHHFGSSAIDIRPYSSTSKNFHLNRIRAHLRFKEFEICNSRRREFPRTKRLAMKLHTYIVRT